MLNVKESHIHYSDTAVTVHVANWYQIYMKSCIFRPVMFAFKMQSSVMLCPADLEIDRCILEKYTAPSLAYNKCAAC